MPAEGQIERIFHSAVELTGSARAAYLEEACRGDERLQGEVASLLAAYEKTGSFMNVPAHQVAAHLLRQEHHSTWPLTKRVDEPDLLALAGAKASATDLPEGTAQQDSDRRRWIIIGCLVFAFIIPHAAVILFVNLQSLSSAASTYEWAAQQRQDDAVVTGVSQSHYVAPLRVGDQILAVNGKRFTNIHQIAKSEISSLPPGSRYTLTIRRAGQTGQITHHSIPLALSTRVHILQRGVVLLLIYTFGSFTLFALKPADSRAVLIAIAFALPQRVAHSAVVPEWAIGMLLIGDLFERILHPPILLHTPLVVPEPSPLLGRFPRLTYYLYLPSLLYLLINLIYGLPFVAPEQAVSPLQPWLLVAGRWLFVVYVAAASLSMVINYRQTNEVSRRKLRLLLVSAVACIMPLLLWHVLHLLLGRERIYRSLSAVSTDCYTWVEVALDALPLVVFLSLAYTIIRHRIIPVSLIIRRTVQYLLAKNALRFILTLPVIGLLLTIFADRDRPLTGILFDNSIYFYVLLILVLTPSLRFRRRLSVWIDRRFFREAYNQEQILRSLIDTLKRSESLAEMSRRVSEQVERALHPERLYLFYREEDKPDLSLSYSSDAAVRGLRVPAEFRLLRHMEGQGEDQGSAQDLALLSRNDLPCAEIRWLKDLKVELMMPISGTDGRLVGLLLLGAKRSEVPYTATDHQLLGAIAGQIAVVYENVRLREQVEREQRIKREVLARVEKQDINLLKECPSCGTCFDSEVQFCTTEGSELTLSLPVERTINGRYRLEQLIGKGGMGAVYEAIDLRLHRRVAVKILSSSLFGNSEALRRFTREAQTTARLSHRNIIAVYDYGVIESGGAYLVMEFAHGETLGMLLKREGRLTPQLTAEVFDQVLAGVGAAHQSGVVHRDLKPDNILLVGAGEGPMLVKILDFGLAKLARPEVAGVNGAGEAVTIPGTVMGTLGYMSPEQLLGTAVDERSDLFAIGVMVIEALTGQRPFGGKTYHELSASILHGSFHLPHDTAEARRLDAVLARCLAKERARRYGTAGDLQRELIAAVHDYRAGNHYVMSQRS